MIKKTITYDSLFEPGKKITRDYYFHLSKSDMVDLAVDGTFEARIKRIMDAKDNVAIVREFKRFVELSIGMRVEGTDDFVKTPEFAKSFMASPAFDELLMELMTSPDQGTSFIVGLLPGNMQEDAKKEVAKLELPDAPNPFEEKPAWIREDRDPTTAELQSMTREQLQEVMARKLQKNES